MVQVAISVLFNVIIQGNKRLVWFQMEFCTLPHLLGLTRSCHGTTHLSRMWSDETLMFTIKPNITCHKLYIYI